MSDKADGLGRYNLDDGRYFEGLFEGGLKSGEGVLFDSKGKVILKGTWKDDEM